MATRKYNQEYYRIHGVDIKAHRDKSRKKCKSEVLEHYGGKCACCGESHVEFLAIDHIDGGGNEHRKKLGKSGTTFYFWLRKQGFPDGYRVLCHNCNQSRGYFGYCPHEKKFKKLDKEHISDIRSDTDID